MTKEKHATFYVTRRHFKTSSVAQIEVHAPLFLFPHHPTHFMSDGGHVVVVGECGMMIDFSD